MRRRHDPLIDLPSPCIHHWLCGEMDQQVVHAICKKCDAKADFNQGQYPWSVRLLPRQLYDATSHWTKSVNEVGPAHIVEAEY